MPIGGSNVAWDPTSPPDTESAGLGDDRIRSLKTSVQEAINNEHNFPSTGGAGTGYHLPGSARPFFGLQSLVSSSGSDARLMQTSDTSRLFGVGSGGTTFLGGPTVISAGSFPGGAAPQRYYWAMEFGADVTNVNSGVVAVTIPNSGYSGAPFVIVTPTNSFTASSIRILQVYTKTATVFNVAAWNSSNGSVAATFDWVSIGTRTF